MADIETIGDRIGLPSHMKITTVSPKEQEEGDTLNAQNSYTVLVNPESYQVIHRTEYVEDQAFNSARATYRFNKVAPESFKIELLFDSTGSLGKVPFINKRTVLEQINHFLQLGFPREADECDKKNLIQLYIIWGDMLFKGLLEEVDITYSHFDATGSPIRAVAKCKFTGGQVKVGENPNVNVKPKKQVDFAKEKHAINGILKYGSYIAVVSRQPRSALPKSFRIAAKLLDLLI